MLDKVSEPYEIAQVRQKIAAIGPKFDPDILEATRQYLRRLWSVSPRPAVKVTEDIAYGTDPAPEA